MATNLRLSEAAAAAVRQEAERSGRSQQDVIRDAVDSYLGAPQPGRLDSKKISLRAARLQALAKPPKIPYMKIPESELLPMPDGLTSLDLLDREDRF
jgi:hypothetical protein